MTGAAQLHLPVVAFAVLASCVSGVRLRAGGGAMDVVAQADDVFADITSMEEYANMLIRGCSTSENWCYQYKEPHDMDVYYSEPDGRHKSFTIKKYWDQKACGTGPRARASVVETAPHEPSIGRDCGDGKNYDKTQLNADGEVEELETVTGPPETVVSQTLEAVNGRPDQDSNHVFKFSLEETREASCTVTRTFSASVKFNIPFKLGSLSFSMSTSTETTQTQSQAFTSAHEVTEAVQNMTCLVATRGIVSRPITQKWRFPIRANGVVIRGFVKKSRKTYSYRKLFFSPFNPSP